MKNTIFGLLLMTVLFSCGEDNKAKYDQKLDDFKANNLDEIKTKYDKLLSFKKEIEELDTFYAADYHKDIKISLEHATLNKSFNSIYLDYSFFDDTFPFQLPTQNNLNDIDNLVNNRPLDLYMEESPLLSIDYLDDFIAYCENFVSAKHMLIHVTTNYRFPKYEENGLYSAGEAQGFFCVYDFDSGQLLDDFIYKVESSEEVEFLQDNVTSANDALMADYFGKINLVISSELKLRYDVDPETAIPSLELNPNHKID